MLLLPSSLALLTLGLASVVSAEPQAIHLPLKPVTRRTDIHPEILYQQVSRLGSLDQWLYLCQLTSCGAWPCLGYLSMSTGL